MRLSDYVILGRPVYVDREFQGEDEANRILLQALVDGQKAQAQGWYLLDFCFKKGKLKIRLGEEPIDRRLVEQA